MLEDHPKTAARRRYGGLIDRVPEINKREIRALSIAGALNFDNTIHRRQALWESELAIQPKGKLFENTEVRSQKSESDDSSDSSFILHPSSFLYDSVR